MTAPR